MTRPSRYRLPLAILVAILASSAALASDAPIPKKSPDAQKYTLRYKFQPDEVLRWTVVDRKRVQMSLGGSTKVTESVSRSTKCWRVVETDPSGIAVFENSVEDMEMRQQMSGQKPIRYNSKTDKTPPPGLEGAAGRIGKALARIKIDGQGETINRTSLLKEPASPEKPRLTIPLPKKPVAVGESWERRDTVLVPLKNGTTKSILTQQAFTLKSVKSGVAVIDVVNEILTPIHSPEIEFKLIAHYAQGTARFDVDAGRILSLQLDLDHQVIGFHGGDSSVHYLTRSTEEFVPAKTAVAARPEEPKSK